MLKRDYNRNRIINICYVPDTFVTKSSTDNRSNAILSISKSAKKNCQKYTALIVYKKNIFFFPIIIVTNVSINFRKKKDQIK